MLYAFIGSFTLGIAVASLGAGIASSLFLALLSGALFSYLRFIARTDTKFYVIPLVVLGLGLGIGRAALVSENNLLDPYIGNRIQAIGTVTEEPDIRETHTRLVVDVREIVIGNATTTVEARVLASVEHYPEFAYGDEVKVSGGLKVPESFDTGAGREFNYPAFLAKDGIYYEISFAKAELISSGNGNFIKEKLFAFKNAAIERAARVIPEPESSLLAGILFGSKRSLGEETLDAFKISGITHIIVLSGFNIAIISAFFLYALSFSRFPLTWRLSVSAIAIILFAIMVGGAPSVIRASFMALLVLLARGTGRTYGAFRALMIAGFAMLMHNPQILLFDPGFQLSFIATLGLILLSPIIEQKLLSVTEKWKFREVVIPTLSAQIFVLPLLLYMTGSLSIVSFPANILVLPAVPVAMLFGFVTTVLAFISPIIALIPGIITYGLLSYILWMGESAARLPFAAVPIPALSLWSVAFWYAFYFVMIWKLGRKKKESAAPSTSKFDVSGAYEIIN